MHRGRGDFGGRERGDFGGRGRGNYRGRGYRNQHQDAREINMRETIDAPRSKAPENKIDLWGKKELAAFVKKFCESNETELIFPSTLTAFQRSAIHDICSALNLEHKSSGPKANRILCVRKSTGLNTTNFQGYFGAQLLPTTATIASLKDIKRVNDELDPLYSDMIEGIKVESKRVQRKRNRYMVPDATGSARNVSHKPKQTEEYWRLQKFRQTLPAYKNASRVISALTLNNVVIVCGETGSGKSTQIPQIIFHSGLIEPQKTIICTQPRRISAISVAQRVAHELGEESGNTCGHIIRFENETSKNTRIIYMTTGILLRRLQTDQDLLGVGCVIVDEVHERDVETDFCLMLLRKRLIEQESNSDKKSHLKVVIMSATIQIDKISNYFQRAGDVKIINVPGTLFPVKEYFLEDALSHIGEPNSRLTRQVHHTSSDENTPAGEQGNDAYAAMRHKVFNDSDDLVPYATIVKLILACHFSHPDLRGSILVFLPGWAQITKIASLLRTNPACNSLWILMLHSSLTSSEQQRVFLPAPTKYRKVVLSTNIAETSITIDDVVWVIDSCLAKDMNYNPSGNVTSLRSATIAKANGVQRRGRAGRCQSGVCYHLLPKNTYDQLPEFATPQILRTSLEELCLQVKAVIPSETCCGVLSQAMDSPPIESIQNSVDFLVSMGVFTEDERLTPLGEALAQLPIHPLLGKMLFTATCFGVLDSIAVIAAGLSVKSPFIVVQPSERNLAQRAIRNLDCDNLSDHLCILNLYEQWVRSRRSKAFALSCYADQTALYQIERTKNQLKGLVLRSSFVSHIPKATVDEVTSRYSDNLALIRLVLVWSLFPRIASVEFRKKRPKLPNIICWDDSVANFSNSSALIKRHRIDFKERVFLVYFERIFLDAALNISEATAISPLELALSSRRMTFCPVESLPSVLLDHIDCEFIPAFPLQRDENGAAVGVSKGMSAVLYDGGRKVFLVRKEYGALIQRIRHCMDYYLINAVVNLRTDFFPDALVSIVSQLLGQPSHYRKRVEEDGPDEALDGWSTNPGDHLYVKDGVLVRNVSSASSSSDDDIDDEMEIIYEDDADECDDGAASHQEPEELLEEVRLTDAELQTVKDKYGDLLVLQRGDTQKIVTDAASNAQRVVNEIKTEALAQQTAAAAAQEAKQRFNVMGAEGDSHSI